MRNQKDKQDNGQEKKMASNDLYVLYKTLHYILSNTIPTKPGVNSGAPKGLAVPVCGTRHVIIVTNLVINYE
jgi:hypothetical protein